MHEALVRFAFDIMAHGKDWCNRQDVMELVGLLHSESRRIKETTSSLMGIMDPHNKNKVSFETFRYGEGSASKQDDVENTVVLLAVPVSVPQYIIQMESHTSSHCNTEAT